MAVQPASGPGHILRNSAGEKVGASTTSGPIVALGKLETISQRKAETSELDIPPAFPPCRGEQRLTIGTNILCGAVQLPNTTIRRITYCAFVFPSLRVNLLRFTWI